MREGSSITLKMGPEVKSIRLVGGDHNGDSKTDMGGVMLNADFLKKARRRALTDGEPACRCRSLHAPPTTCLPGSIEHGA